MVRFHRRVGVFQIIKTIFKNQKSQEASNSVEEFEEADSMPHEKEK